MRYLALALLVFPAAASAQSGNPKAFFEGVYKQLSVLTQKKDVKGMEKLLKATSAPGFYYYPSKGPKLNESQLLASMRSQMKAVGTISLSTQKIEKIVLKGDRAVVTVSSRYAMALPVGGGKNGKLAGSSLTNDTWINTPRGWKLKEIKTVKETATLDGKPISG